MPKLTIGMAVFDDFANVWSTLTALRVYHAEVLDELELIVVDNSPNSPEGQAVKTFVEQWVTATPGLAAARYEPFTGTIGTAAPRNRIFEIATGDAVLCMDSHVMLEPESLRRLIEWYDANPTTLDLYSGPLIYDDLKSVSTHFENVWRDEMWGTWGTDEQYEFERTISITDDPMTGEKAVRVSRKECQPFDIFAMGLGLFTCRREAWLGFSPLMKGFGGEECYIHEKFRQAGRRCVCLPWLRWVHQFGRPGGVKYPLTVEDKFRNYVIGLHELGFDLSPAIEHFEPKIGEPRVESVLAEFSLSKASLPAARNPAGAPDPQAVVQTPVAPDQQKLIEAMMNQMQQIAQERDQMTEERDKAMTMLQQTQQTQHGAMG
jgi:hypothetical protein